MGDFFSFLFTNSAIKWTSIRNSFFLQMLLKALLRRPLLVIRVITRAVPYLIIREGSSPLHRADVKRSVRMLFSDLLTFIPWYISSLSVARTFASCRLYAEWRIDDVLAFIVAVADFTFAFQRDVASASRWLFQSDGTCGTGARVTSECTCKNKMRGLVLHQSFSF